MRRAVMKKTVLTLLILLSFSGMAIAEKALKAKVTASEEVIQLDFREALKMAVEKNRKLRAFENKVSADKSFISVQRGEFLPSVNFRQNFVWTDNPGEVFGLKINQENLTAGDFARAPQSFNDPDDQTNFLSEITLEQTVYNRGDSIKLKMAKKKHTASESEYLRTKEKVVLEVARAYLNVKTAKQYVEVAQKSIETAKEHNRIAKVRFENELGLYSDVLRTNTFLKKAEQRHISALKNYEVAQKALGLAIGISDQVETGDAVPEIEPYKLAVHKNYALARSDIQAAEVNYENARNKIKLQKSMYYPTLSAGGNYQSYSKDVPFGFEGNHFQLYGSLRWNLFDGLKKPNLVKIAEYELQQAKELLEDLKNRAEYEVFDAFQAVNEKKQNLELAEAALESAEEGMKLVEVRYKNSLSPIVDLLDAQLNLDQARADVVKSRNEYLFSLVNLSFASGTILNDLELTEQEL